MITQTGGSNNYVHRTWGNLPVNTGNWTVLIKFKYTGTPDANGAVVLHIPNVGNSSFVFIGSDFSLSNVFGEITNGVNTISTASVAITLNTFNWFAITYNSSTKIPQFYLNGTLLGNVGAGTCDMSAVTFNDLILCGDAIASANVSVGYCRGWNNILSSSELTAESSSILATKKTGLLWDNPLQASIDLTSHDNTFNQFVAVGTITTDTNDPLLSIIAGPPTNLGPNTAALININSVYFQDVATAGLSTNVWFYFIAPIGFNGLGAIAFGDLVTYNPRLLIYASLADALANNNFYSGFNNRAGQFVMIPGNTYYFQINLSPAVVPSILKVSIILVPNLALSINDILINDDTTGFPIVALSGSVDYGVKKFISPFAAGESGDILTSGISAFNDVGDNKFHLYSAGLLEITSISMPGIKAIRANRTTNKFWVGFNSSPVNIQSVDTSGNLGPLKTLTGSTSITQGSLGISIDESKLYYALTGATPPVKVWDLVNNVALADLAAGIVNYLIIDILVLADTTILVLYFKTSPAPIDTRVIRYQSNGTVLNTYNLGANGGDHLAYANDDPNSFWIWNNLVGTSVFQNIKISDGSLLLSKSYGYQYEAGRSNQTASNTPTVRLGISNSCTFIVWPLNTIVNTGSGLYFLTGTNIQNPKLTHDVRWIDAAAGTKENVAIPNPFWELLADGESDQDA